MRHARWLTLGLWLIAASAQATTLLFADIPALTTASDVVMRGRVASVVARWSSDQTQIFTEVDVSVLETLKGETGRTLRVRVPGGVVGTIGQHVDGAPQFSEGEEVLLFLEKRGDGFVVSHFSQGKFRVERSSDGTTAFAVPAILGDVVLLDALTRTPVSTKLQPVPLQTVRGQVQRAPNAASPVGFTTP